MVVQHLTNNWPPDDHFSPASHCIVLCRRILGDWGSCAVLAGVAEFARAGTGRDRADLVGRDMDPRACAPVHGSIRRSARGAQAAHGGTRHTHLVCLSPLSTRRQFRLRQSRDVVFCG